MATLLSNQEVELLNQVRNLLEEILETIEVAGDRRLMRAIRQGMREAKRGRGRSYGELVRKLRGSRDSR